MEEAEEIEPMDLNLTYSPTTTVRFYFWPHTGGRPSGSFTCYVLLSYLRKVLGSVWRTIINALLGGHTAARNAQHLQDGRGRGQQSVGGPAATPRARLLVGGGGAGRGGARGRGQGGGRGEGPSICGYFGHGVQYRSRSHFA